MISFTEHWLKEGQIKLSDIDHFKLVSNFSKISSEHEGSCIYVRKYLQTTGENYFQGISKEKDFKMTIIDKLELCVYLFDTTIRWKMYVYLLHKINYMFRPYFHSPSLG